MPGWLKITLWLPAWIGVSMIGFSLAHALTGLGDPNDIPLKAWYYGFGLWFGQHFLGTEK